MYPNQYWNKYKKYQKKKNKKNEYYNNGNIYH